MVDIAAGFAYFADRLPKGTRVGIVTPSGGAGAWLADACEANGLTVPPLDDETRAAIWSLVEWLTRWPWGPGAYGAIDRLVVAGAIVDELARESA